MTHIWVVCVLLACSAISPLAGQNPAPAQTQITARAISLYERRPNDRRAGQLIYRGGLELTSNDRRFGGLSDLIVSADGARIVAVSDMAFWLKAHLSYDVQGKLAGMDGAEMAPILNQAGVPMIGKDGDAEGLAAVTAGEPDAQVLVSFEHDVRVWRYDLSHGLNATPTNIPVGLWVAQLDNNRQLEAITLTAPDTFTTFAEVAPDDGDIPGALEAYPGDVRHMNTRQFTVALHEDYAITSAANTPDGGIYLLERRYSLLGSLGMEIRYVPRAELHAGARIEGTVIAKLSNADANVDNMEGIAVRKGARGETLIYVLSDDNYNGLQRTVLMMFEVAQ